MLSNIINSEFEQLLNFSENETDCKKATKL